MVTRYPFKKIIYKQAACRSDSRIRHLFAEQGTHNTLAVGQTSDSRSRPTRMMLPNCFYFVRLFFRIGITRQIGFAANLSAYLHRSSGLELCKGRLKGFQTAFAYYTTMIYLFESASALFQRQQQLIVYAAKAAVAHHQNMIACLRLSHNVLHQGCQI